MNEPGSLYAYSNKWGWSLLGWTLIGVPFIVALALAYSYGVVYIPIAGWVTFLLLFGFVMGLGMGVSALLKLAKCRSDRARTLFGLATGVVAWYAAWVFFLHALVNRDADEPLTTWAIVSNPQVMFAIIGMVYESGWYSIKSATPSGLMIGLFWLIEGGVIVVAPLLLIKGSAVSEMFCETCSAWCTVKEVAFLAIETGKRRFDIKDAALPNLLALKPLPAKQYPCVRAEALQCPHCEGTRGLRFAHLAQEVDKDGKKTEQVTTRDGVVVA